MSQYRDRIIDGHNIVDLRRRPGDRHKGKHKGGKPLSKWKRRLIVAWDGEGFTRDDGAHIYNLLANSNNVYISDHNGLPTDQIFMYLLNQGDPKAINVIYGGSYDVNMWLKDVPLPELGALWTTGHCYWKNYKISYAHRKKFTIQEFTGKKFKGGRPKPTRTFVLWDVLGYFQASFVEACYKWLGDLPILREIQSMKLQRSTFTEAQFAEVLAYNRTECYLLVELIRHLFDAMDEAGIELTRYDGAGSIAANLLRVNKVKQHMGEQPLEAQMWAACAYSGGRIEAVKVGTTEKPVYRYDINSAYPSACISLPSFKGATWTKSRDWNLSPYSLVKVQFSFNKAPFYPLWYRESNGAILYPSSGQGVYWGAEILPLLDKYGSSIFIEEAYNCTLANYDQPFEFIERTYEIRRIFKRRGSMASEALKLGMNSIYGKLAQQAGYHGKGDRIPAYHNLSWAGLITAITRAKMYQTASRYPNQVIAFATDAIISSKDMDDGNITIGDGLGEWTADRMDGITIVQAGVYWLKKGDEWQAKYRGFDKGSLSREYLVSQWYLWDSGFQCSVCYKAKGEYEECDHIHASLTRFVGLGGALMTTEFYSHWTRWETMDRRLSLVPDGKRQPGKEVCFSERLCATVATEAMNPSAMSTPYKIAWLPQGGAEPPTVEGVAMRIIEEEEADSYA